jgi:uncharacterized protein YwqG
MTDFATALDRLPPHIRREADHLVRPRVAFHPAADRLPRAPSQSFVGGHPFVPAGADPAWPVDARGRPMVHLIQLNFAELPELDGFPTEGMLQLFCEGDAVNCYGLTFDGERQGIDGIALRWWSAADLREPSAAAPTAATPFHGAPYDTPLESLEPVALAFGLAPCLPGFWDAHAGASDDYEEFVGNHEDAAVLLPSGCHVGGYPYFAQTDPRQQHPARASVLLLQLDSPEDALFNWGDSGSAQLFGDPGELAAGRLDSLWWDWACG